MIVGVVVLVVAVGVGVAVVAMMGPSSTRQYDLNKVLISKYDF